MTKKKKVEEKPQVVSVPIKPIWSDKLNVQITVKK